MEKKNAQSSKAESSAKVYRHYNEPEQLSFLPEPAISAAWPSPDTLAAEAHARLLTGERLTQPSFGTDRWRLAAYVQVLKELGWPVRSVPVRNQERSRTIAEYWYDTKTIAAALAMQGVNA